MYNNNNNNMNNQINGIINDLRDLDIYINKLIISNKDVIDINIFDYIKIADNSIDTFLINDNDYKYKILSLSDDVNIMNYICALLKDEYKHLSYMEIIDRLHKIIINDIIDDKSFRDEININNILQEYDYEEISHDLLILQSNICKYIANMVE